MTQKYIKKRLERLQQNRSVGKAGLSIKEVRNDQVKVRFTEDESDFLSVLTEKLNIPKAVLSNLLILEATIDMLAEDDQLCQEVMEAWTNDRRPALDFFQEINIRASETCDFIDGDFHQIEQPASPAVRAISFLPEE